MMVKKRSTPAAGQFLIRGASLMLFAVGGMIILVPLAKGVSVILAILSMAWLYRSWNADGITRMARKLAVVIAVFDVGIVIAAVRALMVGG